MCDNCLNEVSKVMYPVCRYSRLSRNSRQLKEPLPFDKLRTNGGGQDARAPKSKFLPIWDRSPVVVTRVPTLPFAYNGRCYLNGWVRSFTCK